MAKRASSPKPKRKNTLSAKQALKKLQQGNARFLNHDAFSYQNESERRIYKDGQWPYAVILCCADSRVAPEIAFSAAFNELFVVRVAGNIANTCSIASIEYAVQNLNTNLVVVLGHEGCGAVSAAMSNAKKTLDLGHNLNSLIAHITPAIAATEKKLARSTAKKRPSQKDKLIETIKMNARLTKEALVERSPAIANERGVEIVPAYYEIVSGKVDFSI